jgi:TonB family protein
MNEGWKQWEGQVVDGKFRLQRFLGGSEHGGVFLVDQGGGGQPQTAIKLVPAESVDANEQLRQWKAATELDHPNVIRVLETGRCEAGGTDFLYVLTEYAEEDLSQILPERALTEGEARQVIDAVLKGLGYVHGRGLVHGRVKPSNILAAGDVVKISSDSVRAAGDVARPRGEKSVYDPPEIASGPLGQAADVWSLGVTLVEGLTQRLPVLDSEQAGELALPAGIPQPFQEIARHCLQIDPGSRWTVGEIAARLDSWDREARQPQAQLSGAAVQVGREAAATLAATPGDQKKSAKWPYALAFGAVIVVGAVLMLKPKPPISSSEARTGMSAPQSGSTAETRTGVSTPQEEAESSGDVVRRVVPQASQGARNTVTGMIRVLVKVDVDAAGNVTQAQLQSPGPSKYFARLALEAARDWKFKPAMANGRAVPSEWVVRFGFSRRATEGSAKRTAP